MKKMLYIDNVDGEDILVESELDSSFTAITDNIVESVDRYFVNSDEKEKIENTSGVNTGDELIYGYFCDTAIGACKAVTQFSNIVHKADYVDHPNVLGITMNAGDALNEVQVKTAGIFTNNGLHWSIGTVLFLGLDGEMVPYTSLNFNEGNYAVRLGIMVNEHTMLIKIEEPTLEG
jgi:hypothetical protein